MNYEDVKKYGYFKCLKEEKRRTVEIKYNVNSYKELKKVVKMAENMIKNKEIKEIQLDLLVDYYLE